MITDYQSLREDIAKYLQDEDLEAEIPDFVQLCEARLRRDLDAFKLEKSVTLDITSGEAELPLDYGNIVSLESQDYPRPPSYISPVAFHRDFERNEPNRQPVRFTVENNLLKVKPAPDKTASLDIVYKSRLAPLVNDDDFTITLLEDPDLYLYGSLLASEPRAGNDPRMVTWASVYQEAVVARNKQTRDDRYPSGNVNTTMSVRPSRLGRPRTAKPSS